MRVLTSQGDVAMKFVACTVICLAGWVTAAHADVVYTLQAKQMLVTPPATSTIQLSLSADKLAVEPEPGAKGPHMVFRGDKNVLWTMDPSTKTYVEMNGEMMKSLAAEMGPAMEQMKEQMKALPPDQRAKAEAMMNAQMGGGAGAKEPVVEVKNSGEKQTIAGYVCTHWDVFKDGKKVSEVWAADWSAAHVKKADFAVLKSMGQFMDDLRKSSPMMRRNNDAVVEMTRVDGFPVLVRQYADDKLVGETALQKVESKSIDASAFELPTGYTERKLGRPKE